MTFPKHHACDPDGTRMHCVTARSAAAETLNAAAFQRRAAKTLRASLWKDRVDLLEAARSVANAKWLVNYAASLRLRNVEVLP